MDRKKSLKLDAKRIINAYHTDTYEYKETLKKQLKKLNIIEQILNSIYNTTPVQTIFDSKYNNKINNAKNYVKEAITEIKEQLNEQKLRNKPGKPNPLTKLQACESKLNESLEASQRLRSLCDALMQLDNNLAQTIEEMEIPY